jgi:F0F1-type ATP synthase membrane subunit c/vacuolar-type H+-ATPase subunit K
MLLTATDTDDTGVAEAVTIGVGVGVGIKVTSTVANGVGVGGVGRHAVNSTAANMSTATAAKMIFLFIEYFRLLLNVFSPFDRLNMMETFVRQVITVSIFPERGEFIHLLFPFTESVKA